MVQIYLKAIYVYFIPKGLDDEGTPRPRDGVELPECLDDDILLVRDVAMLFVFGESLVYIYFGTSYFLFI